MLIVTSCVRGKIYEQYIKMEKLSWNRFNVLKFDVDIKDISTGYDFVVAIRHLPEVPYQKIPVNFSFDTPSGESRSLDYDIMLKDKEGNNLGNCMGDLCDVYTTVKEDYLFTEPGICHVELHNIMVKLETPGIIEVGLIVRKHRD